MARVLIVRESPVAYAARLAMMGGAADRKEADMARRPKAEKPASSKRVLTAHETVLVADWLRKPGNIQGMTSYEEVLARLTSELHFDPAPSVRSIKHLMESFDLQLYRPDKPIDNPDAVLRKLGALVIELAEAAMRVENPPVDVVQLHLNVAELKALIGHEGGDMGSGGVG